jgi:hypothetical protein
MAQYPEQRFQSAAEFRHTLENALVAEQVTPAPLPDRSPVAQAQPIYRPQPEVVNIPTPRTQDTRRESWRAVLILLVLVLLALLVYLIFFRDGAAEAIPTPAPGTPGLTARTHVNVRSGPGEVYEAIGLLRQGQTAEIIGVSPDGQWWVIRFPAVPGGQGWVSAGFVDAINIENIPVVQPPPLPTLAPSPPPSSTTAAPTATSPLPTPSPPPTLTQPLPTATEPLTIPTEPLPTPTEALPTVTETPATN